MLVQRLHYITQNLFIDLDIIGSFFITYFIKSSEITLTPFKLCIVSCKIKFKNSQLTFLNIKTGKFTHFHLSNFWLKQCKK